MFDVLDAINTILESLAISHLSPSQHKIEQLISLRQGFIQTETLVCCSKLQQGLAKYCGFQNPGNTVAVNC
jgi:hypothetical protein